MGMIFNKYIGDLESTTKTRFIQRVWELLTKEFQAVCSHEPLPLAEYQKEISEMFDQTDVIPIQVPLLKKVVTYAKEFAVQICREQPENLLAAERLHEFFLDNLLDYSMQQQYLLRTNLVYSNFLISNINKDMMINSND